MVTPPKRRPRQWLWVGKWVSKVWTFSITTEHKALVRKAYTLPISLKDSVIWDLMCMWFLPMVRIQ